MTFFAPLGIVETRFNAPGGGNLSNYLANKTLKAAVKKPSSNSGSSKNGDKKLTAELTRVVWSWKFPSRPLLFGGSQI